MNNNNKIDKFILTFTKIEYDTNISEEIYIKKIEEDNVNSLIFYEYFRIIAGRNGF